MRPEILIIERQNGMYAEPPRKVTMMVVDRDTNKVLWPGRTVREYIRKGFFRTLFDARRSKLYQQTVNEREKIISTQNASSQPSLSNKYLYEGVGGGVSEAVATPKN